MKFLRIAYVGLLFASQAYAMDIIGLKLQLQNAVEQVLMPRVQDARQLWLTYKQQIRDGEYNPQNILEQLDQLHQTVTTLASLADQSKCKELVRLCDDIGQHLLIAILDRAKELSEG